MEKITVPSILTFAFGIGDRNTKNFERLVAFTILIYFKFFVNAVLFCHRRSQI